MHMTRLNAKTDDNPSVSSTLPGNEEVSYVQAVDANERKSVEIKSDSANATIASSMTEIITGPLPHPDYLERYNDIIKDGAERIMQMAEKEQASRLDKTEASIIMAKKEVSMKSRGQWFAFTLAIIILGLATLFVFTGHDTVAYILFATGIASVVGLFLGVKAK